MTTAPTRRDEIDEGVASLVLPVGPRQPVVERLRTAGRELTSTPRRAALATAAAMCAVLALAAMWPTTIHVGSSIGPTTVRCGLDSFVYRYPDQHVVTGCRHAEAGRLALFIPCLLVAGCAMAGAALVALTRSRASDGRLAAFAEQLIRSPARAASSVALGASSIVAILALRPATVETLRGGDLLTIRCGADTYFFGYPDAAIDHTCSRAYAGHAAVLGVALGVGLAAALALAIMGVARAARARQRRLVGAVLFVAATVTVAVFGLRPAPVRIDEGGTAVTASCGVDAVVAGYPDRAVQRVCRAHVAHRLVTAAGVELGIAGVAVMVAVGHRRRREAAIALGLAGAGLVFVGVTMAGTAPGGSPTAAQAGGSATLAETVGTSGPSRHHALPMRGAGVGAIVIVLAAAGVAFRNHTALSAPAAPGLGRGE
jgi:hypothetical protein